jgi:hypothetical protein
MKRARLKKGTTSRKKQRLVSIGVDVNHWRQIQSDAIKKGFMSARKGSFHEMDVPVDVGGDSPVYVNVQITGKSYDRQFKKFAKEGRNEEEMTDSDREQFDNFMNLELKEGWIGASDVSQVYMFKDDVEDLKKRFPGLRTMPHWNSSFVYVHKGDFMKMAPDKILAWEY